MNSLVRREDTTRKAARERKKQKKEEQIHQKKEEIKRLKNLKMKEVRSKLERIGQEGGKNLEDDGKRAEKAPSRCHLDVLQRSKLWI